MGSHDPDVPVTRLALIFVSLTLLEYQNALTNG